MTTNFRVLMLGWEYPPEVTGGLGAACQGIVRTLAARDTDVIFVAPRLPEEAEEESVDFVSLEEIDAVGQARWLDERIKRLAAKSALSPYLTETAYAEMLDRLRGLSTGEGSRSVLAMSHDYGPDLEAEVERYASVLEVLASTERFDVIHAHDWMTFPAGVRIKRLSRAPLVLHVHSLELDRNAEKPDPHIFRTEKEAFREADHVVAVSFYTKGKLAEEYEVPEWKVSVIHNAVSRRDSPWSRRMRKPFDRKVVLFLGRITSQKGPEIFVDAAAKVLEADPDVWFVMAGSGDMLPRVIERAARLRIGRNFYFTGFLRGPEVERMYAMSDLYVMPSVSEPFGMTSLEAILYDVPVIVSRRSGVAEILKHAIQVDARDVHQLANAILAVLRYPALRRMMVRMCGDAIAGVCWETTGEKIQDVYRMVVEGAERCPRSVSIFRFTSLCGCGRTRSSTSASVMTTSIPRRTPTS